MEKHVKEHLKHKHPTYFQSTPTARFENQNFLKANEDSPPTSISSNDNMVNANVTEPPTKHI